MLHECLSLLKYFIKAERKYKNESFPLLKPSGVSGM
jgi:hypothetical protein